MQHTGIDIYLRTVYHKGKGGVMMDAMKSHKHYTYADYCEWPEDVRCEIIDGIAYMMASPSTAHQEVVGEVFVQLATFLKGKPCKVYVAPLSVRLTPSACSGRITREFRSLSIYAPFSK